MSKSTRGTNSLIPWPGPRAAALAVVGHVTSTTARLWFCVPPDAAEGPLEVVVLRDYASDLPDATTSGSTVHSSSLVLESSSGWTTIVDVEGLDPESTFRVGVRSASGDWVLGERIPIVFQTDPVDPSRIRFGLVSCHDPYRGARAPKHLEAWDVVHEALRPGPDTAGVSTFLIAGGDQVYADADPKQGLDIPTLVKQEKVTVGSEALLNEYRELYHRHWAFDEVRRVHGSVATYMMWDDHDIFDGWGSQRADALEDMFGEAERAQGVYRAARQTFLEFQASHNPTIDDGRTDDALDYVIDKGGVSIFVQDGRSCRNYEAGGIILGEAQLERFRQWATGLRSREITAALVVSAVPVVHLAGFAVDAIDIAKYGHLDDDLYDEWDHPDHTEERDEWLRPLFEVADELDVPAVILSGDVHVGAAFRLQSREYPGASVFQVTSSAVAQPGLPANVLTAGVSPSGQVSLNPENPFRVDFGLLTPVIEGNNCAIVDIGPGGGEGMETGVCTFWERTPGGQVLEHSHLVLWGTEADATAQIEKRTRRIRDNRQLHAATALLRSQFALTHAGWDRLREDETAVDVGHVDLTDLDFVGFDLSGTDLRAAKLGRGGLAGADLEAAELPPSVAAYDGVLKVVEKQSEHIRRLFVLLAVGCFIAALVIWQLPNGAFVPEGATLANVPLIGIEVSAHILIPGSVVALGLLLIYFANESVMLLASLRRLPLRFPSGSWLHETVHPWVTTRMFSRALERRIEPKLPVWTGASQALTAFLLLLVGAFYIVALRSFVLLDFQILPWEIGWTCLIGVGIGLAVSGVSRVVAIVRNPSGAHARVRHARGKGLSDNYGNAGTRANRSRLRLGTIVAIVVAALLGAARFYVFEIGHSYPVALDQEQLNHLSFGTGRQLNQLQARSAVLHAVEFENCRLHEGDFHMSGLTNSNFDGARVSHADFRSADLGAASFTGGVVSDSDLTDADMVNVTFDEADVLRSDFSSAHLPRGSFRDGYLRRVSFSNANLTDAGFGQAVVKDSAFISGSMDRATFDHGRIERTTFANADLDGASFRGATLIDVEFMNAELNGVSFTGATLIRVDFSGAALDGTRFANATMADVEFDDCVLEDVVFADALLEDVGFQDAQVIDTTFRGATIVTTDFTGAVLAGSVFRDATLQDLTFFRTDAANVSFECSDRVGGGCESHGVIDFSSSHLDGARFDGRSQLDLEIDKSSVVGAHFEDVHFERLLGSAGDFTGAQFDGADFDTALLEGATLLNADFERTTFAVEALLERTLLQGADFTDAVFLDGAEPQLEDAVLQGVIGVDWTAPEPSDTGHARPGYE